jgi:ABC-type dipeptide/oligopeptide/nickel transport system permease subunit
MLMRGAFNSLTTAFAAVAVGAVLGTLAGVAAAHQHRVELVVGRRRDAGQRAEHGADRDRREGGGERTSLVWTPADPTRMRILQKLKGPLVSGLLGTDQLGRRRPACRARRRPRPPRRRW